MDLRFLALLLLPGLVTAQTYRWVDDAGNVHYSDQAPPASARDVQKTSAPARQGASPPLPYALQQAVKNFPVTLYTSKTCDPCDQARTLLENRGVPYKEIGVADAQALEKLAGSTAVPLMTVGREKYDGFESAAYHAALDIAGYPRISLLPPGVHAREEAKPDAKPEIAPGANAPK